MYDRKYRYRYDIYTVIMITIIIIICDIVTYITDGLWLSQLRWTMNLPTMTM